MPSCTEAPEHTTTLEAGGTVASLVLEKGFYRVSPESLSILECFNKDACVGGIIAGQYCAKGYTGPCKFEECLYQTIMLVVGNYGGNSSILYLRPHGLVPVRAVCILYKDT